MSYAGIAKAYSLLMQELEFHKMFARFYHELFNQASAKQVETLAYNPVMKFYQDAAQRHLVSVFRIEGDMKKFEEKANTWSTAIEEREDC